MTSAQTNPVAAALAPFAAHVRESAVVPGDLLLALRPARLGPPA
jgi:hypothetical protein